MTQDTYMNEEIGELKEDALDFTEKALVHRAKMRVVKEVFEIANGCAWMVKPNVEQIVLESNRKMLKAAELMREAERVHKMNILDVNRIVSAYVETEMSAMVFQHFDRVMD